MRLRYKASIVVICFSVFYMAVVPIGIGCANPTSSCTFLAELAMIVVLTIPGDTIIEYDGTVQVEEPKIENFISQNTTFFVTMVIIPTCIIGAITISEKRKMAD